MKRIRIAYNLTSKLTKILSTSPSFTEYVFLNTMRLCHILLSHEDTKVEWKIEMIFSRSLNESVLERDRNLDQSFLF